MPLLPKSSYYDKHYRQTAALIRARQPYLIKNIFTGLGLFGFVVAVYAYTIHAVSQDDFSDVPIPDAPIQQAQAPNGSVVHAVTTAELEKRKKMTQGR